ncbi:hypothetical protein SPF06_07590 [Sinomonas sp. JGH33]|uniref:Integral membrane protein n=1 Tax=Sinomonas terricola TaxID=3110330 RepID=A0ABU5T620_9MICC|nr:hypothetical protein [Sinomonas sp. JGH33]MEA5454581.1 hypothetical protein [Sinomonas sp. JGH33]
MERSEVADNTAPDIEYSPSSRGRGIGRIIVAVYGIFAVSASARAGYQILTKFSEAPFAYILSAVAAVVYIVATVAMARRGVPSWYVTLGAVLVELVGVLVVGTLSILAPQDFAQDTVWSVYGRGYGFVPLVLPFIGLAWLYTNRPRKVEHAAGR